MVQTVEKLTHSIERGNTQIGVNQAIIHYLLQHPHPPKRLLDVPCGHGQFLKAIQTFFPSTSVTGIDLSATPIKEVRHVTLKREALCFSDFSKEEFDVITCISGLIVFDHLTQLCTLTHEHLKTDGVFIVTNDNVTTLRDRFHFLCLGHLKRFRKILAKDESCWNVVLIQGLWKQLTKQGFIIEKVQYTSLRTEDWLFLPLAILWLPLHLFSLWRIKSHLSFKERYQLLPFSSLLFRHYILYARKK